MDDSYEYNAPQFAENFDAILKAEVDESFFGCVGSREEKGNSINNETEFKNGVLKQYQEENSTCLTRKGNSINNETEFKNGVLKQYQEENSTCLTRKHNCTVVKQCVSFKAKRPTVLLKKPFEVKRPLRDPLKALDITLNTEIRSKEREEYIQKIKEWRREADKIKMQVLMKEKEKEDEEIARLRKEAVHKPLPLPSFISRSRRKRSNSFS